VRIEELVNYFPYDYAEPDGDAPLALAAEVGRAPWRPQHRLVRIGLQARRIALGEAPPANFVFLLDVSGSMQPANKLPLLQRAFGLLVEQLRPQDRVAIVVYAGAAGLVLPSTPGAEKAKILEAIQGLDAGGTTAGGAGIRLAYAEAAAHFVPGGNNRVILATDGDFNVGASSDAEMVQLIGEKRASGVFLSVLGFGEGNLQDAKMQKLAQHGNGNYAYIDNLLEARKVLVHEMGGTLVTIAKDVKVQVEFNPSRVRAYRLIGYENRLLRDEDFADDTKDAGDIGSGHSVTALYEVIPVGVESDALVREPEPLRYQEPRPAAPVASDELLSVQVRYKRPEDDRSQLLALPVVDSGDRAESLDFRFQAAVAEFGLLLRRSPHRGAADFGRVFEAARSSLGQDREGYRSEFVLLVERARGIDLAQAPDRG
jgi:Ca-activated chloride channel family protein